jgi:CDP-glycerol glycerophosphotransferase (TagB/SpsB family)
MFEAFGTGFVRDIARRYRVIVRPHPQMKVSQPALYREILELEGVSVDTQRTPADAMAKAHVLLSDISGIAHEFAFIHERPVVIVDRRMAAGGLEGELLGGDSELKERCAEFIVPVLPSEMPNIADHLSRALAAHSRRRLAEVRSELVYNFGTASAVAADQLSGILTAVDAASQSPARGAAWLRRPGLLKTRA